MTAGSIRFSFSALRCQHLCGSAALRQRKHRSFCTQRYDTEPHENNRADERYIGRMLPIDRRPFGRYSDMVSIIGLGGYHVGKPKTVTEAVRIIHAAIDAGINFLDNAWEYHDGESEKRMGRAIQDRRDAVFLMTKVCTHGPKCRWPCGSSRTRCDACARIISICGRSTSASTTTTPTGISPAEASSRRSIAQSAGKSAIRRIYRAQRSGDPVADAVVRLPV